MVLEGSEGSAISSIDGDGAASDREVLVQVGAVVFAEAGCVLVRRGATGELSDAGSGVDGDVLPMTVTADDVHILLRSDEGADLVALMREALVGVAVHSRQTPCRSPSEGRCGQLHWETLHATIRRSIWEYVPDHYDDGGFTDGNMDRPALKRLILREILPAR